MSKLQDGFNIIKARITKKYFPYYVNLILNNSCNLRCGYCYKNFYKRKDEEMPTEKVLSIIDELAALGTRRICILGGEPLLRGDLRQIVETIKSKGIVCGINTNGLLVKANLDLIKKIDYVHVSLDGGDRAANDRNRGQGTFDKIIEALAAVYKNTKTPLGISCTLTKNNLGSIDSLIDIARRYHALVSFFVLMNQENEAGVMSSSDFSPTWDQYLEAMDRILVLKKQGAPIRGSHAIYRLTKKWPLQSQDVVMERSPDFKWIPCFAGKFFCTIDVDGRIYPCPRHIGQIKAQNALTAGVMKAYEYSRDYNPCKACNILCYNELNYIFSLNPKVILNYFKKF